MWVAVGGVAAAVLTTWWLMSTRQVRTGSGADLGSLPQGVTRQALNVVVVTLDTTRSDRIGAYGAKDVETPVLDGIARDGVQFDQAVSVAPLTLPAHSSIFTGKFPPEHGVRDNGGFFLGAEQVTLAEVLKQRGYRTGGFVAAYVLDSKWGIDQGFDTYVDDFDLSSKRGFSLGAIQRPANEVMDKALPWIRESRSSPFFAWIHLYDPHAPYRPPEPFASRYKERPYNGEIAFTDSQLGRLVSELQSLRRLRPHHPRRHGRSRGEPRGSRGERARLLHLQQRDARPLPDPVAVQPRPASTRRRSGAVGRRDADRARPAGRRSACRDIRRQPGAVDDRRRAASSVWTRTPKPCIRSTITVGATSAPCARGATRSSTRRGRSCTTSIATRASRPTCSPNAARSASA